MNKENMNEVRNEMRTLGRTGDVKISWNPENGEEVETAEKMFNEKIKMRWSAFVEKVYGGKGDKITKFDPDAKRIILVPPIAGG